MDVKKDLVITGLDMGSSKTTAVTARIGTGRSFEVIAQVNLPSKGMSKGMIVDIGEATDSASKAFSKLREMSSAKLGDIYVNISGQTIKGARSVGMIPLATRGREIVKPDLDKCIAAASTVHLPFDREIIHKIVHSFSVDDQPWIRNPLGLYASRLSCEVYIVTADVNHIQSIYKCVNDAGYDVKELVFSGLADAASLLDAAIKEEGVALVDIGDSLTEVSVFSGGTLADLEIIPAGSRDVKGGFAENPVFADVVAKIAARIQSFIRNGGTIGSVVLTGGVVFSDGIIEHLEGKLPNPIRIGSAKDINGNLSGLDNIRLSTAIGLAKYGCEKHEEKVAEGRTAAHRLSNTVVDIFNRYF